MTVPVTRTNYRPEELRDLAKRCGNGAQARRAIALILEGHSRQDAAEAQNMDRQTLRDWVHRYNEFSRLNNRPKSGRKVFEGQLKAAGEKPGNGRAGSLARSGRKEQDPDELRRQVFHGRNPSGRGWASVTFRRVRFRRRPRRNFVRIFKTKMR